MAVDARVEDQVSLGQIGFLNVLPIYHPIESGIVTSASRLVTGPPAYLNKLMAKGSLDISSVSSIEAALHPDRYYLVPDLSISSRGPVVSVLLMSQVPVHELDGCPILVTAKSETSIALLELLGRHRWGLKDLQTYKGCVTEALRRAELPTAFLAIGDEALAWGRHEAYPYRVDFGEAWLEWTGLPFVFGLWIVRRDSLESKPLGIWRTVNELMAAKAWGRENPESICRVANRRSRIDMDTLRAYYRMLYFELGEDEQRGLQHFFRLLHESDRLPSIPKLESLARFAQAA
jgi:chorismate dehydratase